VQQRKAPLGGGSSYVAKCFSSTTYMSGFGADWNFGPERQQTFPPLGPPILRPKAGAVFVSWVQFDILRTPRECQVAVGGGPFSPFQRADGLSVSCV